MLRRTVCLGLCLLALPARADERPAAPPTPVDTASEDARFAAFVAEAERELAAGRKVAAVLAYYAAWEIRNDPVIGGRMGVLLAQLHQTERAANRLGNALQFAQTSTAERQRFFTAYEVVRKLGSWVLVKISHAGTTVGIDEEPIREATASAFWTFLRPGEHRIRVRLEGFEDAAVTFTTEKGKNREVSVDLVALPAPAEPKKSPDCEPCAAVRTVGYVETPGYSKQEDPFAYEAPTPEAKVEPTKEGLRFSIGAGPVVVFGAATWQPAVGAVIATNLRPMEWFSVGVEARAAWVTSGVEGEPINAMTAGGIASACGHWRWFYGCALGHLGVITVEGRETSYEGQSDTFVMSGFGGRVGGSLGLTKGFVLGASFDVLRLNSGVKVVAGQTVLVDHPPWMMGGQLVAGKEF